MPSTFTKLNKKESDEKLIDNALRPSGFDEYVGQTNAKENLKILIEAAKKRNESLDHILIHGPSGLGKTTLSYIIAREFGAGIRITSGTALQKAGDIGSILTGLSDGDFLFIDEVHRLNKSIEETLYPAMENYMLDIVIGKGTTAKTLQIQLPKFTLIAATTRISLLSNPFRSRFGAQLKLDFYNEAEIAEIIRRSAQLLETTVDEEALILLASASRYTPRIANRLLRRARDFAQIQDTSHITTEVAHKTLNLLHIDTSGLEATDRKILQVIYNQFKGGPAGVKSIAAAIGEEEDTIEDVYEPFLMRLGLIARTNRGRIITDSGIRHLQKYSNLV